MNKNYKIDKRTPEENKSFYRLLKIAQSAIEEAINNVTYSSYESENKVVCVDVNSELKDELYNIILRLEKIENEDVYKMHIYKEK